MIHVHVCGQLKQQYTIIPPSLPPSLPKAGIMLAHLHELQSENRFMQARIMELASQREFFIATNARLRQTLAEGGIHKVLNGIQLLSSDNSSLRGGGMLGESHRNFNHNGGSSDITSHDSRQVNSFGAHSGAVPPSAHSPSIFDAGKPVSGVTVSNPHHSFPARPSGNGRTFSDHQQQRHDHLVSSHSPSLPLYSLTEAALRSSTSSSSSSSLSDGSHVLMTPPTAGHHSNEITRVTNSVQGPITAYTGLPVSVTSPNSVYYHRHST